MIVSSASLHFMYLNEGHLVEDVLTKHHCNYFSFDILYNALIASELYIQFI